MNANARPLRWTLAATLLGCLLWTAAPALSQTPGEDFDVPDEEGEANGGLSLGVLAGVGLNNGDSEEAGQYLAIDLRLVRPIGSLFGGGSGVQRGFRRSEATTLPRRTADVDGLGVGASVTLGMERTDTWSPPLPPGSKNAASTSRQEASVLDHGGTLFGTIDLLLVPPVPGRLQLIPFAGVGFSRILEGDTPEESNRYTLAEQWGLVFDYGLELEIPVGALDVRAQYRAFRYQVDELEYLGVEEAFVEEVDPVNASALLLGVGINF